MAGQRSPNLKEISEMQNEGGSDVFTSTRHINNTQNVRQIFLYFRDITNLISCPIYSNFRIQITSSNSGHKTMPQSFVHF